MEAADPLNEFDESYRQYRAVPAHLLNPGETKVVANSHGLSWHLNAEEFIIKMMTDANFALKWGVK